MANDMAQARAPRTCEVCGREVTANNYARHVRTHGVEETQPAPRKRRKRAKKTTAGATAKGIGRYLDSLEYANASGLVYLGALDGFPGSTRNPETVANAIEAIRANDAGSALQRLKRQQRIITLTRQLEIMEQPQNGDSPRAFFVEHAAEWAAENGVGYSAFRVMGVPPAVLTEAGIGRTFEP